MDMTDTFSKAPIDKSEQAVFPCKKGIILFDNDGRVDEIYGREHAMMMQEIGYWYIDNWQDFLLNYSYNRYIVVMIECTTVIIYLPKYISKKQQDSFISYIRENTLEKNRYLLKFYIMRCLDINNEDFNSIKRDSRGMINHYSGIDITGEDAIGYNELCNYLMNNRNNIKLLKK